MSQQQPIQTPVSPLRQRMLEDMAMRGLREETQRDYIRFVRSFAAFLKRSPDTATAEDIRRFQVHQAESGVQPPTINCSISALYARVATKTIRAVTSPLEHLKLLIESESPGG